MGKSSYSIETSSISGSPFRHVPREAAHGEGRSPSVSRAAPWGAEACPGDPWSKTMDHDGNMHG